MALVAVAAFMVMFAGLAVVGIDLGRLGHTATEAQNVADSAAQAGALALADDRDADADAYAVAAHTVFNGTHPSETDLDIETGTWDPDTGFATVAAGQRATHVRATAHTDVQNIVAGVFGSAQSPVQRVALAGFEGKGACDPTKEICFPLAIGECHFQEVSQCFNDPSCLPQLDLVPSGVDNSGWTTFLVGSSANQIRSYLPEACGGRYEAPDPVSVGDDIQTLNGKVDNILRDLDECLQAGILDDLDLTIPIVDCAGTGQFNQTMEVVGFATIRITAVHREGCGTNGEGCGVDISTLVEKDAQDPGGGIAKTGTGSIKLRCDGASGQCG